ncbi:hypothetical protein [Ammoniphilus sp. 3BR4]|uniref:hypothetical protein n=1 Tax=Ammoniphilus sp. 3BR4 TaxID=3158265 RepID=UPI003467E578
MLYIVGTIGLGYMKTLFYVPDVVSAYQEVTYLQKETVIAFDEGSYLTSWKFLIMSWLLTSSVFILMKILLGKLYFNRGKKR